MGSTTDPGREGASGGDAVRTEYAALVSLAAAGDRQALERLLMRAQEAAYRFSLLVCGHPEDAEDVMQDALLQTYRHVRRIEDPGAFRTWLYSTVRNACLMKRRRRAGEPAEFLPLDQGPGVTDGRVTGAQVPDGAPPADQVLMEMGARRRLAEALQKLPPTFRLIVVMREVEGLSTKEVAAITGISEANVKTRLHRARLMLRRLMEEPSR